MSPTMVGNVLNFASQVDDSALAQAQQVAAMPFVAPHVALMPDAHAGKGSSVGTVIPTDGAVIPAAVGVDIGCGMTAVETAFTRSDVDRRIADGQLLADLRQAIENAIPLSPGNYNAGVQASAEARVAELERLAEKRSVDLKHSPTWREQLGSLGGGNHFIEVCTDERNVVWLFLHSGSRGVGNRIAQRHIKTAQRLAKLWHIRLPHPDLAYLPQGIPEFGSYIADLGWAQQFALLNRQEMMDRLVGVFGAWISAPGVPPVDTVACHHNYTRKEEHYGRSVWLTRKGAIDAHAGVRGLIPGSMGTRSYVVRGKGNPSGLHSAPHGAGRRFSRTEARRRYTAADLAEAMRGIEYRPGDEWVDEIPAAYKDIDQVMADAADLVEVEHELRQFVNVKGT